MKRVLSQVLTLVVSVPAGSALAQEPPRPVTPSTEPSLLTLPMRAQVRLQAKAAPKQWIKGVLVGADASSVVIVPQNAPPVGANQLRLPSSSIGRLELKTGSRRQWLWGLAAGAALGFVLGATTYDDEECDFGPGCSRAVAGVGTGLVLGGAGAGVGALITTDRWTPVAIDTLAPPAPRVTGFAPLLRVLPAGGVSLGLALGF